MIVSLLEVDCHNIRYKLNVNMYTSMQVVSSVSDPIDVRYDIFQKNSNTPKEHIYQNLWKSIVFNDLVPFQLINESSLCSLFGVSRTPVRDAVSWLVEDDLVFILPQRGTYVSQIHLSQVEEAHSVRKWLEPNIGGIACEKIKVEHLEHLYHLVQKHLEHFKLEDYKSSFICDIEFHKYLYGIAGYGHTWDMMNRLSTSSYRIRYLKLITHFRWDETYLEHVGIYEALLKRDRQAVEELIRKHISGSNKDIEIIREVYKNYIKD